MKNITEVVSTFPVDSVFYTIAKINNVEFVEQNTVYAYKINMEDDTVYIIYHYDDRSVNEISPDMCYKTREEAEKHLTPAPKTVRVAVDENGRLIDFAIFDGDVIINVPADYKVHIEHCCLAHGCKYGNKDCPVVNKKLFQRHVCEQCVKDGIFMEDLIPIFKK